MAGVLYGAGPGRGFINPQQVDPNMPMPMSPEERAGILAQFSDGPDVQPQMLDRVTVSGRLQQGGEPQAPTMAGMNRNALYDGLVQGGVGMLSGRNLQDGLAQGFSGFNHGYDGRLAKDKAMATPKVVPLADGAFSMMVFPDGTQKVVKNDEVAKYLGDMATDKTQAAIQRILLQGDVTARNQQAQTDNKTAVDARTGLQQTQSSISQMQKGLDIVSAQAGNKMAQAQGIPGIKTLAETIGTDDASRNQFLQGLKVDQTLLETARTKGAISNQEMALFESPIPSLTADREKVWKPYLEQRINVLKKLEAFQSDQVSRGEATPPVVRTPVVGPGAAPVAPVTAPKFPAAAIPGLNAGAKYY